MGITSPWKVNEPLWPPPISYACKACACKALQHYKFISMFLGFFFFFQESFLKMQMPKIITKCIWKKPGKRQRSDTISKRNSKPIHTFSWIKNECLLMLLIIVIILFQLSQIPSQLFLFFENKLVPPGHEKWYSLIWTVPERSRYWSHTWENKLWKSHLAVLFRTSG